jgi:hypothetical protein
VQGDHTMKKELGLVNDYARFCFRYKELTQ